MPLLIAVLSFFLSWSAAGDTRFELDGAAQGTSYHIVYYAGDSVVRKQQIDSIFASLDSSLSVYKPYSIINSFNRHNTGMQLDQHLYAVVRKAFDTYTATAGIFDITVFPLVQAWGFAAKQAGKLPDSPTIRQLMTCVGGSKLQLKGNHLEKATPCVQIDVNGIAQGYSVDVVAGFLERQGISAYVVELGGELRVKGTKPGGAKMSVGIESPPGDAQDGPLLQQVLHLDHGALTTSGSYRRYYESEGKKVTHIINPFTGYPEINELISVTVYADDAITADAFDNALMVMGLQRAMTFVNNRTDIAAYFIYRNSEGKVMDTASVAFAFLMQ